MTREEIAEKCYLNVTDISRLLLISRPRAKRLFDLCREYELERTKFIPYDSKVKIETVMTLTGKTLSTLKEQLKKRG